MIRVARLLIALAVFVSARSAVFAQQFADPEFDAKVDRPAFPDHHPLVLLDEAHNNFHTADGRYKPFADLLTNDGFEVKPNKEKFSSQSLKGCTILVVANAQGHGIPGAIDQVKGTLARKPSKRERSDARSEEARERLLARVLTIDGNGAKLQCVRIVEYCINEICGAGEGIGLVQCEALSGEARALG